MCNEKFIPLNESRKTLQQVKTLLEFRWRTNKSELQVDKDKYHLLIFSSCLVRKSTIEKALGDLAPKLFITALSMKHELDN